MSGDDLDLDIKLQDARPRAVLDAPPPEQDPACAVRVAGYPNAEHLRVYLHIDVMRAVEAHAASFPEREVGGVLLGTFAAYQGRPYVRVEQVILGMKAEGSATQLTFTHETWRQINEAKDRDYPHLQIVGWYHSHPDLGIFLSRDALYIHRNFFANERQVALVVDPINHDRGLFVWHHGEVKRDGGLRIYAPAANTLVLEQFVNAIHAPKMGRIVIQDTPAVKAAPQQPVVVKVEFHDASITPFALLPRSWRAFFGVYDLRTAPRISLRSLIILILIVLMLGLGNRIRLLSAELDAVRPPNNTTAQAPETQVGLLDRLLIFLHLKKGPHDTPAPKKTSPTPPSAHGENTDDEETPSGMDDTRDAPPEGVGIGTT